MKKAIFLFVFFTLCIFSFTIAHSNSPRILVDGIHGEMIDLSTTFPDYQFNLLMPADVQIDEILYLGQVTNPKPDSTITITVDVSDGEALLVKVTDVVTDYQLYVSLTNPDGEFVEFDNSDKGIAGVHFDDPEAGTWTVRLRQFSSCYIEIGTGPDVINIDLLNDYDAVIRLYNEELGFLVELPEYSEDEKSAINDFLGDGKGFLYIREPIDQMIDKPIIRLYSSERINTSISIDMPGSPVYFKPSPSINSRMDFTNLNWSDVSIGTKDFVEIDYEGRLFPEVHHLRIDIDGSGSSVNWENLTPHLIRHLHLFKYRGNNSYSYAFVRDLPGNSGGIMSAQQELTEQELYLLLVKALRKEALEGGMTQEESREFFSKYAWIERWLLQTKKSEGWTAIYRITGKAYDELLPLRMDTNPKEIVRILWIALTNIPQDRAFNKTINYSILTSSQSPIERDAGSPLIVHEYGTMRSLYIPSSQEDNLNFGGMQFYDEFLMDPTNNNGNEWAPIIYTFADNDLANRLKLGVEQLQLSFASPVTPSSDSAFIIATGDEDTYSREDYFPPGSYPPAVVASREYGGKIIGIGDMAILDDSLDNRQFMRNCLDWISGKTHTEGEWTCINNDLPNTHINAIGVHPYFSDSLYVGTDCGAYQTEDGGLHWTQIEFSDRNNVIVSALEAVVNPSVNCPCATIYVGTIEPLVIEGFGGRVFRSWVDGEEWEDTQFPNSAVTSVKVLESNPAIAFAGTYDLWYQTGGLYKLSSLENWENLNLGDTVRINCIEVDEADSNFILVGTDKGLFLTDNGGNNWTQHLDIFNISSAFISDDDLRTIYAATNGETVLDGIYCIMIHWSTWRLIKQMKNCVSLVQSNFTPSILYAAKYGEGIYITEDSGENWSAINRGLNDFAANCLTVNRQDPSLIYLGTENGIYRYKTTQVDIKDEHKGQNIPIKFRLLQNYPNPFNSITTINYKLPKPSKVILNVYNITGQLVETLVADRQNSGCHSVIWDASTVSSGIYFYRIQAVEFQEVRKMILLK